MNSSPSMLYKLQHVSTGIFCTLPWKAATLAPVPLSRLLIKSHLLSSAFLDLYNPKSPPIPICMPGHSLFSSLALVFLWYTYHHLKFYMLYFCLFPLQNESRFFKSRFLIEYNIHTEKNRNHKFAV